MCIKFLCKIYGYVCFVYKTVVVLFMLISLNKKVVHKIFLLEMCTERSLDIILYIQHVQQLQNLRLSSVSILLKYVFCCKLFNAM